MSENKTVEFSFVKDPEYRRVHATGVWGSLTPLGEVQFDLIEDTPAAPEKSVLSTSGQIGQAPVEVPVSKNPSVIKIDRNRVVGVTMPISVIPSIIQWLQDKLDEHERNQKMVTGGYSLEGELIS